MPCHLVQKHQFYLLLGKLFLTAEVKKDFICEAACSEDVGNFTQHLQMLFMYMHSQNWRTFIVGYREWVSVY